MKKLCSIMIMVLAVFTLSRCSDDAFNEKYADPSKVSSVSVENLMTGVFQKAKNYSVAGYFRYFGYDSQFLGKYSQTFGFYRAPGMYQPGFLGYADDRYGNFYEMLTQFKKLEATYDELSDSDKAANEAYLMAAKVHVYDYLVGCVDVYGDMPWTDACKVIITGKVTDASAKFDKAEDLYQMVLDDLKNVNARFAAPMQTPKVFGTQDFINEGSFIKWQRYANSLRLRVALRVASQGSLSAQGQAVIKEILENPQTYPLVEDNEQNIYIWNRGSGELELEAGSGLDGWISCRLASGALINRMQGDWRLPIVYCLAKENPTDAEATVFRGTDPTANIAQQDIYANGDGFSFVREYGFLWRNQKWDHQLVSAAEIWFIKAEAYQKGWATGGTAEDAFKRAVFESIKFYLKYHLNRTTGNSSQTTIDPTIPTDQEIMDFADAKWNSTEYVNKEDAIITQKWVNFGIVFVREAWNDIRRTGYPSGIVFPEDPGAIIPNVPNRWKYPTTERSYNTYYKDMAAQDTYERKLFWAK